MLGNIFSVVMCEFHTVKWCKIIYVFCSKFAFCRKLILRTFYVQWDIQTIGNLKTIVDHCPQNFENHRKTIETNGWALKKNSMVMVQHCQNHWKTIEVNGGLEKNINHSIALKNWPSLWSTSHPEKIPFKERSLNVAIFQRRHLLRQSTWRRNWRR